MPSGVMVERDFSDRLLKALNALPETRTMVGMPSDYSSRPDAGPNNAELGYIHEHGAPEAHVPARPFLYPTVKEARSEIAGRLRTAGKFAVEGKPDEMINTLEALGLRIAAAVKAKIVAGIPPPLAESTVDGRIGRRKSQTWKKKVRAQVAQNVASGAPPGAGVFTPLIDTAEMLNSISYVVRQKNKNVKLGPKGRT